MWQELILDGISFTYFRSSGDPDDLEVYYTNSDNDVTDAHYELVFDFVMSETNGVALDTYIYEDR